MSFCACGTHEVTPTGELPDHHYSTIPCEPLDEGEQPTFDCDSTDNATCPYCGYQDKDSWEIDNNSDENQCGRCDKIYLIEIENHRYFTSSKKD